MSRNARPCLAKGMLPNHTPQSWLTGRIAALAWTDPASRAGRLLRLPLIAVRRSGLRARVLQGPLQGAHWLPAAGVHSYWLGTYEYAKQLAFHRALVQGDVVYDIGAHVGFYILLASKAVGGVGHVYSFEPLQRNLNYLRKHLSMNATDNVTIIPAAVADHPGQKWFSRGSSTESGHETGSLSPLGEQEVATVSLDEGSRSGILRNLIKIDVEGAELDVLSGVGDLLPFARPLMFLATHSDEMHAACCDLLPRFDYVLTPLDAVRLHAVRLLDAGEVLCQPVHDTVPYRAPSAGPQA